MKTAFDIMQETGILTTQGELYEKIKAAMISYASQAIDKGATKIDKAGATRHYSSLGMWFEPNSKVIEKILSVKNDLK